MKHLMSFEVAEEFIISNLKYFSIKLIHFNLNSLKRFAKLFGLILLGGL